MSQLSLAQVLEETAARRPDHPAVVLGDTSVSYAALWDGARRQASVLRERGVGPGDTVALLLPNTPHFPMAYYGALALGALVTPVHALLTAEEIQYVLEDSGAKVLVCAAPLLGEGAKGAELAGVDLLAVMDGGDADVERLDALAQQAEPVDAVVLREPTDPAVVLYTSGTTGKPKGAVLSHFNLLMNAQISAFDSIGLSPDDVLLGCLPLFHTFGQTCAMNAGFRVGATLVLMPRFDGPQALQIMVDQGVTAFLGVPTMYMGLLAAAKDSDARPTLRVAASGGSALPVAVIDQVKEVFHVDVLEGYGLSETSPVATFNQAAFGTKAGSVGHPVWGVDVEIARAEVEERIELLGTDELGEIVIRGHNIMLGYLNRPEATAEALVDGWFRSGDLGVKDADGFVSIVDRKKDMILRGGYNVYPREVEEVLARHEGVAQVAVIGLPHETHGEEVVAVVVREQPDASADEEFGEELIAYSREHLAKYKYPRTVQVVTEMPLGPSGKVLKRELVEQYS